MTIKELKKAIKNLPDHMEIYFRDHDQGEWDYNNRVNRCKVIDFDQKSFKKEEYFNSPDGKVLMLLP
jgi:hypothetical protein